MPKQLTITLSDQKFAEFSQLAQAEQRDVHAVIADTLEQQAVDIEHSKVIAMRNEIAAYHRLHTELVKTHLGKTVAVHKGQVVDADDDPIALLLRIRANYPNEVVLRRKVENTPEPTIHFRSLRLAK